MRFMVMVKSGQGAESGALPGPELLTAMGKYNQELAEAGVLVSAEGLHPTAKGARVQFSGTNRTVVDGPFTESKELIAGFWIFKVNSLEEAVEWVKRSPNPFEGESEIELRRIYEAEDFGPAMTPELQQQEERLREQISK